MKRIHRLVGLCAALSLSLPVMAFELLHTEGAVKLERAPERVVSFDLSVVDTLQALSVPLVGVPNSTYEDDLKPLTQLPKIGTLFEPDYAVLNELKPDLIFASGRSRKAIPELQQIAPTVIYTAGPTSFLEGFRQNNLAIASAYGKTEQAQKAIAAVDQNIAALHKANKDKTGAFLFVNNGNVMTHVEGDRFGYVFELTGLTSVLPAKDLQVPAAPRPEPNSPEAKAAADFRAQQISTIAQTNPDWLIVLDRGAIGNGEKTAEKTIANHPELSQTAAFKSGRVAYVDPNRWYVIGGGLNNLKVITDDFLAVMQ